MSSDDDMPPLQRESSNDEVEDDIRAAQERLREATAKTDGSAPAAPAAAAAGAAGAGGVANPAGKMDDETDEDEDEEAKPYGKKAVKKMMAAMDKPVDPSFADDLEADEEGYKPITWAQLSDAFSYERQAHGFKLYGDISQRDREHWERSKQIKIRDRDGREGAVFFYEEESEPHFQWDDVQVGNEIVVKSPRFHRFLDGQEGMRIEKNSAVARVSKRKFTDVQRLDYGRMNKNNGNTKYGKKKYDDAIQCYETAINYLQGTYHDHPEFEQEARELTAQCYLNIAASQIGQGRFRVVEIPCRSALRVNANDKLNAKAYFRIGQAALKLNELPAAKEALVKALELAPGDPAVVAEVTKLNEAIAGETKAQKELFDLKKKEGDKKFGFVRTVLAPEPPQTVDGLRNFRDVGGKLTYNPPPGRDEAAAADDDDEEEYFGRVPRATLLRSAHPTRISKAGLNTLSDVLRVKTILDLRTPSEVKASRAHASERIATANKERSLEIELYKTSNGARGVPAEALFTVESRFAPIEVSFKNGADANPRDASPSLKLVSSEASKGKTLAEAKDGPVIYRVDMTTRAVLSLSSWWTLCKALLWGLLALFYAPLLKTAAAVMVHGTALRVGVEGFYSTTLRKQAPEIAFALRLAGDEANYPLLVHCSMGKDRTGIIVALILAIAGVSDDDVAAEYAAITSGGALPADELGPLALSDEWKVAKADTMRKVLAAIKKDYGSLKGYLESIGVSEETQAGIRAALAKKAVKKTR